MAFKLFLLAATLAIANAGLTVTSTSDNVYRSPGNHARVSTQSKSVETPYSSSTESDVRVSDPSVTYATVSPAVSYGAAPGPVYDDGASPVHASPAPYTAAAPPVTRYSLGPQVQYHAAPQSQIVHYGAPAPVYHAAPPPPPTVVHRVQTAGYANYAQAPVDHVNHYAQAPVAHATYPAPGYAHGAPLSYAHAAPQYDHRPLLGVAFSPASDVAHLTYSNVNDRINYGW